MNPIAPYPISGAFEESYIALRDKESRLYNDVQVAGLPTIDKDHIHYGEWKLRGNSLKKLIAYLKKKAGHLSVLEVGCGNGWLSAQVAANLNATVTGTDINSTELEQAKRVFHNQHNLNFIDGDIRNGILNNNRFDVIIFAAAIQYFPSLAEMIDLAMAHLTAAGEIHILDTHFYKKNEIAGAKKRTNDYFETMGFGKMSDYYFHHSIDELNYYHPAIFHDPHSWKNTFSAIKNPFPWFVIKKMTT
jgi:ubiquinone/menaquinone biosynthesis C-methylase UbiE